MQVERQQATFSRRRPRSLCRERRGAPATAVARAALASTTAVLALGCALETGVPGATGGGGVGGSGAANVGVGSETASIAVDAASQPVVLAEAAGNPHAIAVDGTHVYWTHWDAGEIMKAPIAGGAPVVIAESCSTPGIAVSGTNVYWTCSPYSGVEDAVPMGVYSAPLDGGTPVLLSTGGLEDPVGLAVDATSVYVGDDYAVKKVPLEGGAAEELALGSGSRRVRVDGTHVYWTNADASSVRKVPIEGGESVALATGYFESHEVVLDATHVYWTTPGEGPSVGSVNKVPKEGGVPVALATGQPSPYYIALDDTHVYWVNTSAGEIRRVPIDGGEAAVVISGVSPNDLAVDGTSIYWTDASGLVMKLAK